MASLLVIGSAFRLLLCHFEAQSYPSLRCQVQWPFIASFSVFAVDHMTFKACSLLVNHYALKVHLGQQSLSLAGKSGDSSVGAVNERLEGKLNTQFKAHLEVG